MGLSRYTVRRRVNTVHPLAKKHNVDIDMDDSEVSEADNSDLRTDLEAVFKGTFVPEGKFASCETFTTIPPPGLRIDGIGAIGLPLTERDAKLIEAAATQAPFGRGVETDVVGAFEINPDKFSITNPAWTEFLRTVTKKVADGLGLSSNQPLPRAEPYKLVLFKAGSHSLPDKDTEESQGTFASLIIVLPSKFEGGEVHVSHCNRKDVFNISLSSAFTTSALAWYTNVTHELKPVTSGYYLAISYNLVSASPGPPPRLPDMDSAVTSAVEKIFRKWKRGAYDDSKFCGILAYILDHRYSDTDLKSATLKGKDATLVSNIKEVAEKQGVSLCLGVLECKMSGGSEACGSGETECAIKGLYDLEGDLVTGHQTAVLNPEFDVIPRDPEFQDQEPDDKEFDRHGDEGAVTKCWYRRSGLVMFPDYGYSKVLLVLGGPGYVSEKLKRWKNEGPTESNRKMVRSLNCGDLPQEHRLMFIDLALEWGDFAMWDEALQRATSEERAKWFSPEVVIRAWDAFTFDRTKPIFERAIQKEFGAWEAIELIRALRARAPVRDQETVKVWLEQQTTVVLSPIGKMRPSVGDVGEFVRIAESEGLLFLQTIVERLVGFRRMFDFWVGLAEGLWKSRDKLIPSGGTPEETSTQTTALNHILNTLIVAAVPSCTEVNYSNPQDHIPPIMKLLDLMALIHNIQGLGQLIAWVFKPQGNLLTTYQLVTPLIVQLRVRYQHNLPILDTFLRALVEGWIQGLLGTPSKQPKAIAKRVDCGCAECEKLNEFLRSGAVVGKFPVAKQKRRVHMEKQLKKTLSGDVIYAAVTIVQKAPQGLRVTKTKKMLEVTEWSARVGSARTFLALVGTSDELVRIMGERYRDLEAALAGTRPYEMGDPTFVVDAHVESAPVASASTTRAVASGTWNGPVVAGVKRKAVDYGDEIELTYD